MNADEQLKFDAVCGSLGLLVSVLQMEVLRRDVERLQLTELIERAETTLKDARSES